MGWFVPQDRGFPSWIETDGDFSRITKSFDDSGISIILSRMGFLTNKSANQSKLNKEQFHK